MIFAAAIAMVGLASCSSKEAAKQDTATVDSESVLVQQDTTVAVAVDSLSHDSVEVGIAENVTETVTPVQK